MNSYQIMILIKSIGMLVHRIAVAIPQINKSRSFDSETKLWMGDYVKIKFLKIEYFFFIQSLIQYEFESSSDLMKFLRCVLSVIFSLLSFSCVTAIIFFCFVSC